MSQYLRAWRSSKDHFGWSHIDTYRHHLGTISKPLHALHRSATSGHTLAATRRSNLQTLLKLLAARLAETQQYIDAAVANHCLYLFRSLVWLVVGVRYHLNDFDCAFNNRFR